MDIANPDPEAAIAMGTAITSSNRDLNEHRRSLQKMASEPMDVKLVDKEMKEVG